jgi:hypothetical protein
MLGTCAEAVQCARGLFSNFEDYFAAFVQSAGWAVTVFDTGNDAPMASSGAASEGQQFHLP